MEKKNFYISININESQIILVSYKYICTPLSHIYVLSNFKKKKKLKKIVYIMMYFILSEKNKKKFFQCMRSNYHIYIANDMIIKYIQ